MVEETAEDLNVKLHEALKKPRKTSPEVVFGKPLG